MSTLSVSNITDGTDTVETGYVVNGSAKAWVNFDGTTASPTIQNSANVSSITDNSSGNYAVNLTNNMTADYSATVTVRNYSGAVSATLYPGAISSSSFGIYCWTSVPGLVDVSIVCATAHGDLA